MFKLSLFHKHPQKQDPVEPREQQTLLLGSLGWLMARHWIDKYNPIWILTHAWAFIQLARESDKAMNLWSPRPSPQSLS